MYNFKKAVLISVSLIISLFTMAQNSKELTLQHLMPGGKNYSSIVPQNIKQLQFAGDRYIYVSGNNVIAGEPAGSETTLITKAEIDKMLYRWLICRHRQRLNTLHVYRLFQNGM